MNRAKEAALILATPFYFVGVVVVCWVVWAAVMLTFTWVIMGAPGDFFPQRIEPAPAVVATMVAIPPTVQTAGPRAPVPVKPSGGPE